MCQDTQPSNAICTTLDDQLLQSPPGREPHPAPVNTLGVVTPICPTCLQVFLNTLPILCKLVLDFLDGFHLSHITVSLGVVHCKCKSAFPHADFLDRYIPSELEAGRISGPFLRPQHPAFISSPLGVIPKKEVGSFRVIHDLSYLKGRAVNDFIPWDLCSVVYEDFDQVSALIICLGIGSLIAIVDIQLAFCIFPIHPDDQHLLGFPWQVRLYMDNCLPTGCSLSCALFKSFSKVIQTGLLQFYGFSCMSHILDDFIFIGPADSLCCHWQLDHFLHFGALLGIPVKHSKTVAPTTVAPIQESLTLVIGFALLLPFDMTVRCGCLPYSLIMGPPFYALGCTQLMLLTGGMR